MAAMRRAVVVLPLVPVTRTQPCPRLAPRDATRSGATARPMTPGRAVPPPRRRARLARPAARPAATARARRRERPPLFKGACSVAPTALLFTVMSALSSDVELLVAQHQAQEIVAADVAHQMPVLDDGQAGH